MFITYFKCCNLLLPETIIFLLETNITILQCNTHAHIPIKMPEHNTACVTPELFTDKKFIIMKVRTLLLPKNAVSEPLAIVSSLIIKELQNVFGSKVYTLGECYFRGIQNVCKFSLRTLLENAVLWLLLCMGSH